MHEVLNHAFFKNSQLGEEELRKRISSLRQNMMSVKRRVNSVLSELRHQSTALCRLLTAADDTKPSLVCIVPCIDPKDKNIWRPWWLDPEAWLTREVRLYFDDPITFQVANTNDGKGLSVQLKREWVAKAMPYLKVALSALQVAAAAGRLAGFPIPELAVRAKDIIGSQLESLASLVPEEIKHLPDDCLSSLEEIVADKTGKAFAAAEKAVKGAVQDAGKELDTLLASKYGKDWAETKSGLKLAVCMKHSGLTAWVLPDQVRQFQARGNELFAQKSVVDLDVLKQREDILQQERNETEADMQKLKMKMEEEQEKAEAVKKELQAVNQELEQRLNDLRTGMCD
eukprot:scaffold60107_cov18-Prasinocladus_malaysianus.AAC.2